MTTSSFTKVFTLALAGIAIASPVPVETQPEKRGMNVIVGYRKASADQAQRYNAAGTLTDDGNLIASQIGAGVYTAHGRDTWPGNAGDWTCVITMDSDALDRVSKAWVPETFGGQTLWYQGDELIGNYIQGVIDDSWDPARTLRMSIISGLGYDDVQMVIPPALLNSNGGALGIVASCMEDANSIPDSDVNYDDWQNNIGGWRTDPAA
ncbi:hypothetical protein F5Y18DRAFT_435086 [Xylariaceae sp. FL1019]|nr:hypothetical protein F5Y18DRAFT_435086 [Xylariaceae sp. FL1019]